MRYNVQKIPSHFEENWNINNKVIIYLYRRYITAVIILVIFSPQLSWVNTILCLIEDEHEPKMVGVFRVSRIELEIERFQVPGGKFR